MGDSLAQAGWRFISDPQLTRGGCKIETPENLIDATYESRWARLTELMEKNEIETAPQTKEVAQSVQIMPTIQADLNESLS